MKDFIVSGKSMNSFFRKSLFVVFAFFCFPALGSIDSLSSVSPRWNLAFGYILSGWYDKAKGEPSEYFASHALSPKVGYFINENIEIGPVMMLRIQRSNLEIERNYIGLGGGYYFRYNFTNFNPIRFLSKKSYMISTLNVEWEHLFSNYRFMDVNEREPLYLQYMNMTRGSRSVYHHFIPKVGLRLKVVQELYINFQALYLMVNQNPADFPFNFRVGIEYSF